MTATKNLAHFVKQWNTELIRVLGKMLILTKKRERKQRCKNLIKTNRRNAGKFNISPTFQCCRRPESNRYGRLVPQDFKSCASASSATPAFQFAVSKSNGWRWIRTTEAICSRFTVCPLWPLGNPSIYRVRILSDPNNNMLYHNPI